MLERTWTRETAVDLVILLCGILLAIGPLLLNLGGAPAWNARFSAMVILLSALADLTARPQWSSRVNVVLGGWLIFAPWVLNFYDQAATDFHLVIGAAVLALSAAKLWGRQGHPPWLYEPGAAARAAWLRQTPPETEPGILSDIAAEREGRFGAKKIFRADADQGNRPPTCRRPQDVERKSARLHSTSRPRPPAAVAPSNERRCPGLKREAATIKRPPVKPRGRRGQPRPRPFT